MSDVFHNEREIDLFAKIMWLLFMMTWLMTKVSSGLQVTF